MNKPTIFFVLNSPEQQEALVQGLAIAHQASQPFIKRLFGSAPTADALPYTITFFSDIRALNDSQSESPRDSLLLIDLDSVVTTAIPDEFDKALSAWEGPVILFGSSPTVSLLSTKTQSKINTNDSIFIFPKSFNPKELSQLITAFCNKEDISSYQELKQSILMTKPKTVVSPDTVQHHVEPEQNQATPQGTAESCLYMSSIVDSISSVIICADNQLNIKFLNAESVKLTGKPVTEALEQPLLSTVPFLEQYEAILAEVISDSHQKVLKKVLYDQAQDDKFADIEMTPLKVNNSLGILIKIDDVSESVKKDEHLRQAQKMDSVGSLAAGIAHDFNNIIGGITATLSSIKFSVQMANDLKEFKSELSDDLEIIEESAQKGADMIEQLLALSRKKELEFSKVDLNNLVKNVVKICQHTFTPNIEIKTSCSEEHAYINAYPTQLEQAILNLCINASHAMTFMRGDNEDEYGGVLTVSVEQIAVGQNMASMFPDAKEGTYWLLAISDTGIGMSRETLEKIFEPFFTTKEKGKGTGLGLSVVFNIIRKHRGFIEIFSEPGQGTTFMIFLPEQKKDTT